MRGEIEVSNEELDDLVLVRSDETPTYNLCVVVDDLDMNITHVIRGDDHINNTFRQINIFEALRKEIPIYGHVPMILGVDGKRMSKRHGAVNISEYKEMGILSEALLNYLTRLGWSLGDQEIFQVEELIQKFKDGKMNNSPASFALDKLLWFNKEHLSRMDEKELVGRISSFCNYFTEDDYSLKVLELIKNRCSLLSDFEEESKYFFKDVEEIDFKDANKTFTPEAMDVLKILLKEFSVLEEWTAEKIHRTIEKVMESANLGMGQLGMPLRLAVTGRMNSPSVDKTCAVLGRNKVIKRLEEALNKFL